MCHKYVTFLFIVILAQESLSITEEDEGVKYASKCEVCKILATELEARLDETGKTSEVIETGYHVDDVKPKKKKEYVKSELRLVESLEGCENLLEQNEGDIEHWYFNYQGKQPLKKYLCENIVQKVVIKCLNEQLKGDSGTDTKKNYDALI
nr:unnamed protein product [Callosobruchus analis]